jgi:hypothetical protein
VKEGSLNLRLFQAPNILVVLINPRLIYGRLPFLFPGCRRWLIYGGFSGGRTRSGQYLLLNWLNWRRWLIYGGFSGANQNQNEEEKDIV